MDFTSKMIEEYSSEKERLVQEISKGQKVFENLVNSFKSVFQVLSVRHSFSSLPPLFFPKISLSLD
jgi:hypothetical protein